MVNSIKYYLVDSENVNDNWLMLLDLANEEDEIVIFYTKNSPHMSYMSVVKLLGNTTRKITFEECYEGNNALDFQLISYMGYLMNEDSRENGTEFVVMSNDTGFDAAVKFWKKKGFAVRRVNVNFCKIALHKHKTTEPETPVVPEHEAAKETAPVVPEHEVAKETAPVVPEHEAIKETAPVVPEYEAAKETAPVVPEHEAAKEQALVAEVSANSTAATCLPEFTETEGTTSEDSKEISHLPEFIESKEQSSEEPKRSEEPEIPVTSVAPAALETPVAPVAPAVTEGKTTTEASEEFKQITFLPEFVETEEDSLEDFEESTHLPEFSETKEESSPYAFDKQEVDEIINCITKDSLESLHETLVHIYGRDQGQKIYKTIKSNAYPYKQTIYSRKEKVTHITDIIFLHSDLENPGDFVDFLEKNKNKTKNLNGIRSAINKTYGSANGIKYYSLFKPYFKIISAMK